MAISVGSKVRYNTYDEFDEYGMWCAGLVGTVMFIDDGEMPYAVQFEVEGGHECYSPGVNIPRIPDGRGWWAYEHELEVVE